MGHHHNNNYSKFFKNTETNEVSELNNGGTPVEEVQIMTSQVETLVEQVEDFTPKAEEVEDFVAEVKSLVLGAVSGCKKLYVRKEASKESAYLCILDEGTEVTVDLDAATTEDFYKVCTAAGIEGYCMKKFISIK